MVNLLNEAIVLRPADIEQIAQLVSAVVLKAIEKRQESKDSVLVPRERMAELASISVTTLDRLVRTNVIPSLMVGSKRLFNPEAVIAALQSGANDEA